MRRKSSEFDNDKRHTAPLQVATLTPHSSFIDKHTPPRGNFTGKFCDHSLL